MPFWACVGHVERMESFLAVAALRSADASAGCGDDEVAALALHFDVCRVQSELFPATGRGMGCVADVGKGEDLLAIPLHCCWTAEAARSHAALAALGDEVLDAITPENLIALHLLLVKATRKEDATATAADRCRWQHARLLAATPVETLWDWSEEELSHLAGSKWQLAPGWSKQDTLQDFDEWSEYAPLQSLFAAASIDASAFLWAHGVLMSRMISFSRPDGSTLHVIAPGVDMFNHDINAPVSDDDVKLEASAEGKQMLVVRANRAYTVGEQAFFSYSGVSNGRLLFSGGFVLPNNVWDSVELALSLPLHARSAPLYEQLATTLDSGAGRGGAFAEFMPSEFLEMVPPSEPASAPTAVVLHVRLAGATVGEQIERVIPFYVAEAAGRGASGGSEAAERDAAAGRLRAGLDEMLSGYPASLQQNEEALAALEAAPAHAAGGEAQASRRRRHALHVIVGEQRILQRGLHILEFGLGSQGAHGHDHSHGHEQKSSEDVCDEHGHEHACCHKEACAHDHAHASEHDHSHGSGAMQALVDAFSAAVDAPSLEAPPSQPQPPPAPGGPPPLGSILSLVKDTGRTRKECKFALMAYDNDYDAARWSLMPSPPEGIAVAEGDSVGCAAKGCCSQEPVAVPGIFEPAAKFDGGRAGWIFKKGPLGVGYYCEGQMHVAVEKAG